MWVFCTGDEKDVFWWDQCLCRACGPMRKHTRDVLTNLGRILVEMSFCRIFCDASEEIQGLICITAASNVFLESEMVGDPLACDR